MGLQRRIEKLEGVIGNIESLTFRSFFREFLGLVSNRSRGLLPSQEKEEDPEFDQVYNTLLEKYSNQASEEGRRQFQEDLAKSRNSMPDDEGSEREEAL